MAKKAAKKKARKLPQPPQQPQMPQMQTPQQQGGFSYTPTAESQFNQPYQDVQAAGAYGGLQGALGRMGQQGQMSDLYGQTAQGSLGQFGQLMAPNMNIQQGLAGRIQDIMGGKLDVDPMLLQQFGDQSRVLNEQLRRNLGPDYANSSAGIEALSKFNQLKNNTLASANFNQLQGLLNQQQGGMGNIFGQGQQMGQMLGQNNQDLFNQAQNLRTGQLGGANQMLQNLAAIQNLYAGIPQTMGQFGQAMSGQAGAAVNAQDPYQRDRMAQLQASYAPTKGGYGGMMLQNQGDRLINSASAMGGGGGGAPQLPDQSSFGGY